MKGNVCHLQSVQVVSVLIKDGRAIVHHAVPGHHPRACGKKEHTRSRQFGLTRFRRGCSELHLSAGWSSSRATASTRGCAW